MDIGDVKHINANTRPGDIDVVWSSSNEDVATVDENGNVTARSVGSAIISATLSNNLKSLCTVEVTNEYVEILSSLSRGEFYYLAYPPNIYPTVFLNNFPVSPTVSTLSYEKKLLSIKISRKYKSYPLNDDTIEKLKKELNDKLGTNYNSLQAKYIYAEYDMATSYTSLPNGAHGYYYTPKSIESMNKSYLSVLNDLATLVAFKAACNLNPFDSDGHILFKKDKYSKYYDKNLKPIYPGTNGDNNVNGFVNGESYSFTFEKGDVFDRYGGQTGRFAAPAGTPYAMRSLEPGTDLKSEYHVYIVEKSFDAQVGYTAPWFCQTGGGIQYYFDHSIQYYIDNKYISVVE